jgi:hypothetical protein
MKTTKTSIAARFQVRHVKRGWRMMGGRWWCSADKLVVVGGGVAFANTRRKGLGVKNHENKGGSSFSGTPCETGVQDDEGRWWCSSDKLLVVVGRCLCKYKAG